MTRARRTGAALAAALFTANSPACGLEPPSVQVGVSAGGVSVPDADPQRLLDVVEHTLPALRSTFTVYHVGRWLLFTGEQCDDEDLASPFSLHVFPVDPDSLPTPRRRKGFEYYDFHFTERSVPVDRSAPLPSHVQCAALVELPDYDVARIGIGQYVPGGWLWRGEIRVNLDVEPIDAERIAAVIARDRPVVRSEFDVYRDGDWLIYAGSECSSGDVAPPFFLHVFPVDEDDLPPTHRREAFDFLDFRFPDRQLPPAWFKGAPLPPHAGCLALVLLPGYDVARVRTGQYLPVKPWLWSVEFEVGGKAP